MAKQPRPYQAAWGDPLSNHRHSARNSHGAPDVSPYASIFREGSPLVITPAMRPTWVTASKEPGASALLLLHPQSLFGIQNLSLGSAPNVIHSKRSACSSEILPAQRVGAVVIPSSSCTEPPSRKRSNVLKINVINEILYFCGVNCANLVTTSRAE